MALASQVPDEKQHMGGAALQRLQSAAPPLYLSPSPELSKDARAASTYLFSALLPFCPAAPPVDRLLADEAFDAEQIWEQINLISRPLLSLARRELGRLEREAVEQPAVPKAEKTRPVAATAAEEKGESESKEGEEMDIEDEEEEEEEEGDEEEDGGDEEGKEGGAVEDRFLKIKELEEYLEKGDVVEYGASDGTRRKQRKVVEDDKEEEEDDDDEEDELEVRKLRLV